ncbi:hypothetical protein CERSUDRAFT_119286, partial [Gelatoporia subvermispora B]
MRRVRSKAECQQLPPEFSTSSSPTRGQNMYGLSGYFESGIDMTIAACGFLNEEPIIRENIFLKDPSSAGSSCSSSATTSSCRSHAAYISPSLPGSAAFGGNEPDCPSLAIVFHVFPDVRTRHRESAIDFSPLLSTPTDLQSQLSMLSGSSPGHRRPLVRHRPQQRTDPTSLARESSFNRHCATRSSSRAP